MQKYENHILKMHCNVDGEFYHQYGVLVDNKDAQHAECDWLTVQAA